MEGLRGCIEKIVNQSDDSVESAAPSVEVVVKSEVVDAAPTPKAPRKQSRKQAAEKSQLAEVSINMEILQCAKNSILFLHRHRSQWVARRLAPKSPLHHHPP